MADWKMIADLGLVKVDESMAYTVEVVESPSGKSCRGKLWEMYKDSDGDWAYTRRGVTFPASSETIEDIIKRLQGALAVVKKIESAKPATEPTSPKSDRKKSVKNDGQAPKSITLPGLGEVDLEALGLALSQIKRGSESKSQSKKKK